MLDNSLLWQLKYPNGTISFLFGTMHLKDEYAFKYSDLAIRHIELCDYYFGEIDLNQANELIQFEDYLMPGDMKISQMIPVKKYNRIYRHCNRILGVDIAPLDRFLPMVLVNKLAEMILDKQRQVALDQYLWMKADEMNKLMGGVESAEIQLKLLKSLDLELQLKMFCKTCQNLSNYSSELKRLRKYYEAQQILKLYTQSTKNLGAMKTNLIFDRNIEMAKTIIENENKSSFYAIGAAHLAGYHGVLRHLKKEGIKISAIKN